jgi:hypothetical protein
MKRDARAKSYVSQSKAQSSFRNDVAPDLHLHPHPFHRREMDATSRASSPGPSESVFSQDFTQLEGDLERGFDLRLRLERGAFASTFSVSLLS